MSFQAYLDTILTRTGKTPEDFLALARERGLRDDGVKTAQITAWLKEDFGLGQGHAMAVVKSWQSLEGTALPAADRVGAQFSGPRAVWRESYDRLLEEVGAFGPVAVLPTDSYVSFTKKGKKFAIVAATADRLDVGIKLKGAEAGGRFEEAGSWNAMVTHRVRLTDPEQLDAELLDWLRRAYEAA